MTIAINKTLLNDLKSIENMDNIVIYGDLKEIKNDVDFVFGTVNDNLKLIYNGKEEMCSYSDLKVTDWLAFLKEQYVNSDGYFMQTWQLNDSCINKFCRSNDGKKTLTGNVIKDPLDLSFVKESIQEDVLLYIAPIKEIKNEFRFWVVNGEIVEWSECENIDISNLYHLREENNTEEHIKNVLKPFVENIIGVYYEPAIMYTIDVGTTLDGIKVIEYNAFGSSCFYNANVKKIISRMSYGKEKIN